MASSGSQITAADYITIQDKAQSLLGTGTGTRGYGQTVQSADVFTGNNITKAQWDLLRYDVTSIRYHQDGVMPAIVTVNVGDPIGYGGSSPNSNYDTLLDQAIANRFVLANNQSIVANAASTSYSSTWSLTATSELTVTFSTPTEARYFFNSGGTVRINSIISGGSTTAQVNAWKTFLSSVGTRAFGANTDPAINYYTLTNAYQTYYQNSLSTPYSANNYVLEAKTDVADNSSGTATVLTIKITLNDSYVDPGAPAPGDSVDGTLTVSVAEVKAAGSLFPSGTFAITSPSYSLSSIIAS